jgi:hypothetical protein
LFFFFGFFFLKKKKKVTGAFWKNKKVKMVELQQFKNLGESSITLETLEVKVQMGG